MMAKTSKFYAFTHCKCPNCRRGNVFSGSMYGFNIQQTYDVCSHCAQKFEIEPGYFYAAMYVSYAMNVAEMLFVSLLTYIFFGPLEDDSFWIYISTIFSGCFILYPFNYRYSRIILLHWLSPKIKYTPYYDN
jgi:uncharacterized protein (DUF983 family)